MRFILVFFFLSGCGVLVKEMEVDPKGAYFILEDGFECDPFVAGDPAVKSWVDMIKIEDGDFVRYGSKCNDYWVDIPGSDINFSGGALIYEGREYVYMESYPRFDDQLNLADWGLLRNGYRN